MKRIIYVILCLAAAAGLSACGTARKAYSQQQQSSATVHEDSTQKQNEAFDIFKEIEASKTSATEITYTEIEYYPSQQPGPYDNENKPQDPANLPGENGCPKYTPSDLTKISGAATGGVKSIKQVIIKHNENAGASGSTAATLQTEKELTAVKDSTGTASASTQETREPDKEAVGASKSWARAIIAIAAVVAGLLLLIFLWRSGAFSWLRAKLKK